MNSLERASGEGLLRNFEMLKQQLADAAERGEITVSEFEAATGLCGADIREVLLQATRDRFDRAAKAITSDMVDAIAAVTRQRDNGNITAEQFAAILGANYDPVAGAITLSVVETDATNG